MVKIGRKDLIPPAHEERAKNITEGYNNALSALGAALEMLPDIYSGIAAHDGGDEPLEKELQESVASLGGALKGLEEVRQISKKAGITLPRALDLNEKDPLQ